MKKTEDYEVLEVQEVETSKDEIKDVVAEEKIAKLDDENAKKAKKNKKLKDKVSTRNIVIVGLIIIIIILLLRSCSGEPEMNIIPEFERQVWDIPDDYDVTEHEDGQVSIMGWSDDTRTISKSKPELLLKNPTANSGYYYLKFRVFEYDDKILDDEGKVKSYTGENTLYESKLLTAGDMLATNFAKDLSVGEHKLIVRAIAYDVNNKAIPMNGADVQLKLIVTE